MGDSTVPRLGIAGHTDAVALDRWLHGVFDSHLHGFSRLDSGIRIPYTLPTVRGIEARLERERELV